MTQHTLLQPEPGNVSQFLTDLFHRLNSVIPTDQEIMSVLPDSSVREALDLMRRHGFSQLPVVINRRVLGFFSYRSFSQAVINLSNDARSQQFNPLDMSVDECLERPTYARVTDEFRSWFDSIDRVDAVLVGDPDRLQGIVTAMDILRFLYGVASPFVLLAEIELSLRALIRLAVDPAELLMCAKGCLKHYPEGAFPETLEEMTFSDYVQIVGDGRNWNYFEPVFRGNRVRTRTKLEQARDLRNDVFHFRRRISVEEFEALSALRDWMLQKATTAEARRDGGAA